MGIGVFGYWGIGADTRKSFYLDIAVFHQSGMIVKRGNVLLVRKDDVALLKKDRVLGMKRDSVLDLKKETVLFFTRTMFCH